MSLLLYSHRILAAAHREVVGEGPLVVISRPYTTEYEYYRFSTETGLLLIPPLSDENIWIVSS